MLSHKPSVFTDCQIVTNYLTPNWNYSQWNIVTLSLYSTCKDRINDSLKYHLKRFHAQKIFLTHFFPMFFLKHKAIRRGLKRNTGRKWVKQDYTQLCSLSNKKVHKFTKYVINNNQHCNISHLVTLILYISITKISSRTSIKLQWVHCTLKDIWIKMFSLSQSFFSMPPLYHQ